MKVSVCMITYNHDKFIAEAIDSVLMQEVNFGYELVIGEDCSTDNTRDIVVDYKNRYLEKIKLLLREKNLGMMQNFVQTLQACQGEYIALCEGDDYWISPHKLQKQVDFLDSHPGYSICSHNVKIAHEDSARVYEWHGSKHPEVYTLEDLLEKGSGGATCSLVFRNRVFGDFPEWYHTLKGGDWVLQILCATQGKLRYFREVMGVYRKHSHGSFYYDAVAARSEGKETIALSSKNSLQMCEVLDKYFNYRYTKLIQRQKAFWYWRGAMKYVHHKKRITAMSYLLKAMPGLSFWSFLRGLWVILLRSFLPRSFVKFLRFVRYQCVNSL